MQVNINRDNIVNSYATRDITNINVDEYTEIVLCLKCRLEQLEEKLEEFKNAEDRRLEEFIPRKENEIIRLKELIEKMQ